MPRTDEHQGTIAENIVMRGQEDDDIHAYLARPMGDGPYPGMVLFHHRPGWSDWYKEIARLFAYRGYVAICPDLYCRWGHGEPDDVAARVSAEGGVADSQVVGDGQGAMRLVRALPVSNGKVGFMGTCSGGRHAYLAACLTPDVDAVVDCWGGRVVMDHDELDDKRPVAPIDYTASLPCPVLGIFGEDDKKPSPEQVAMHEAELQRHGKDYEFHTYPGAAHGFFYHHRPANYRAEQAVDGWNKVWDFLERHLRR